MYPTVRELISASLGKIPLSLKIQNSQVLNVFSGEILKEDVGIYGDTIVFVGDASNFKSEKTFDANGLIAIPGLIDTHLHIESTMVTPANFANAVLPFGTTTVFADPHEIVNVLGKKGLKMMVENARGSPMKIFFFTPSCVPESAAVTSGAEITPEDVEETLEWEGVSGVGEVMDFDAVLQSSEKMIRILEIGRRKNAVIDGHCPLLTGARLAAYVASGPEADHENFDTRTALEKLRAGLYLKLRGPDVLDMKEFISALDQLPSPLNILFVTDDVLPDRLAINGHLNYVCQAAIAAGMDPVEVVRNATLRPAMHMRQYHLGSIAPGKKADILLLKNLASFDPSTVISSGKIVAQDRKMLSPAQANQFDIGAYNTVKLQPLAERDFEVIFPISSGKIAVNCIDFPKIKPLRDGNQFGPGFLEIVLTNLSTVDVEIQNGQLMSMELAMAFVFERHGKNKNRSFGFVRNLLESGALATTVSHDAHNLVVVGKTRSDMIVAANEVISSGGGVAVVQDGAVLAKIELPIAGLISEDPLDVIAKKMARLREAFSQIGMIDHPYMPIPFLLTLSVIPHARITDKGIFNVDSQSFVPPFVQA